VIVSGRKGERKRKRGKGRGSGGKKRKEKDPRKYPQGEKPN